MSYVINNSFGKPSAAQGQDRFFGGQADIDNWRTAQNLGPGTHASYSGRNTECSSLSTANVPEKTLTTMDNSSQNTVNIPPREVVGHQPADPFFTITQKDNLSISAQKVTAGHVFSASYEYQHSSTGSSSNFYNWLSGQKTTPGDLLKSTSNAPTCGSAAVGQRLPSEPSYQSRNPQMAENILKNYGLEKSDLEELLNYSEEQTTAQNLPYLLNNLRMKKAMGAASAVQSNSNPTSLSGIDTCVRFGHPGLSQDKMSASLQPLKVTNYEGTAACPAKVDAITGRGTLSKAVSCINSLQTESFTGSNLSKDLRSSDDQMGSSLVVPSYQIGQSIGLQTQLNHTCPSGITQFSFGQAGMPEDQRPNNNFQPVEAIGCAYTGEHIAEKENIRNTTWIPEKSFSMDSFQSSGLGEEAKQQSLTTLKNRSLVCPDDQMVSVASLNSVCNVLARPSSNPAENMDPQQKHTSQPLPPQHKKRATISGGEKTAQEQGSNIEDPIENQQKSQKANFLKVLQILLSLQPPESSAAKQDSASSLNPAKPVVSTVVLPDPVTSNDSVSNVSLTIINDDNTTKVSPPKSQSPAKTESSKDLPSLAMMRDYAAHMPTKFPHTCILCKKECAEFKDWVDHLNSTFHNVNCLRLQHQYPNWDGQVPSLKSGSTIRDKSLPPTSSNRLQYTICDSRSRSNSSSSRGRVERSRRQTSSRSPDQDIVKTDPARARCLIAIPLTTTALEMEKIDQTVLPLGTSNTLSQGLGQGLGPSEESQAATVKRKQPCAAVIIEKQPCGAAVMGKQPCAAAIIGKQPCAAAIIGKQPCGAAVIGKQPCGAAVIGKEPCAAVVIGKEPSATVVAGKEPGATVVEGKEPSATVVEGKELSATVVDGKEPSAMVVEGKEPSATPVIGKEPCAPVIEGKEPCAPVVIGKEPCAPVVIGKEPCAPVVEGKEPCAPVVEGKEPCAPVVIGKEPCAPVVIGKEPCAPVVIGKEPCVPVVIGKEPCAPVVEGKEPCATPVIGKEPCAPVVEGKEPCAPVVIGKEPCAPVVEGKEPCAPVVEGKEPCAPVVEGKEPCAPVVEGKEPCAPVVEGKEPCQFSIFSEY
ncbi:uncharacterized protein LOC119784415 [Cyprinodon tularosa]|uniref:uncharacterized protein LOC119784415 n=1 Tax=Cyprinodon tularosa TaxID=77115 RepID=UPI0018E20AE0|nr:uncharacterized protein LOC119784415 [Cyprinodon tularosa]